MVVCENCDRELTKNTEADPDELRRNPVLPFCSNCRWYHKQPKWPLGVGDELGRQPPKPL
jgi:NMD protein affecting ribosome stability and mRNA decay